MPFATTLGKAKGREDGSRLTYACTDFLVTMSRRRTNNTPLVALIAAAFVVWLISRHRSRADEFMGTAASLHESDTTPEYQPGLLEATLAVVTHESLAGARHHVEEPDQGYSRRDWSEVPQPALLEGLAGCTHDEESQRPATLQDVVAGEPPRRVCPIDRPAPVSASSQVLRRALQTHRSNRCMH